MADEHLSEEARLELKALVAAFRDDILPFYRIDRDSALGQAIRQSYVQTGEIARLTMSQEEGEAFVGHAAGGTKRVK